MFKEFPIDPNDLVLVEVEAFENPNQNHCYGCFGAANNDCLECPYLNTPKGEHNA